MGTHETLSPLDATYEKLGVGGPFNRAKSRKLLCQLAHFCFKLPVIAAAIGKNAAESGVKLARLRSLGNLADISGADSCAWHNDDPFPGGFDEFREHRGALHRALRAA